MSDSGAQILLRSSSEPLQRVALSPQEAADALGLSVASVYRALLKGELRAVKRGARWLIPMSALREFCGETADGPTPERPLEPAVWRLVERAMGESEP